MCCSADAWFRMMDVLLLGLVFLVQNVGLNYFIIKHYNDSSLPFLSFLADFFVLSIFMVTMFLDFQWYVKAKQRASRPVSRTSNTSGTGSQSNSSQASQKSQEEWLRLCLQSSNSFIYITWIFYSLLLACKISVLFKSDIPQTLEDDAKVGPHFLKVCLGLTAVVFSIFVVSNYDTDTKQNKLRNSYIYSIAYGVALEILDSVTFLSLLIPEEEHLAYPFVIENAVIMLASVNIMMPAVTILKLQLSNYGEFYHVPLEILYKFLHLLIVNVPYLCLRIYLWKMSPENSIFLVKNIYAIIGFFREIYSDIMMMIAGPPLDEISNQSGVNVQPMNGQNGGHYANMLVDIEKVEESIPMNPVNTSEGSLGLPVLAAGEVI